MSRFVSLGDGHYRLTGGLRGIEGPGRRDVRNLDLRGFDGRCGDRLSTLATFVHLEHLTLTEAQGADLREVASIPNLLGFHLDGGRHSSGTELCVSRALRWLMINDQEPAAAQQIVTALPWNELGALRVLVLFGGSTPIDLDLSVLKPLGALEQLTLQYVRHTGDAPSPFDRPVQLPRTLRRIDVMSDTPAQTERALREYLRITKPEVVVSPSGQRFVDDGPTRPLVRVSRTPWSRRSGAVEPPDLSDWSVVESEDYVGMWWTTGELLRLDAYRDLETEHDAAERAEGTIRRRDPDLASRLDFDAESGQTAIHGARDDLEAAVEMLLGDG